MRWLMTVMIVMLAWPAAARAAEQPLFAQGPVSDAVLADARGGQSPFASLTVGSTYRLLDADSRFQFRSVGTMARIEMDNWWGSTGSELVATSVRMGAGR